MLPFEVEVEFVREGTFGMVEVGDERTGEKEEEVDI